MSAPININISELLAAMEEASAVQPGAGFTMRELMEHSGYGLDRCKRLVRSGIQAHILQPSRKTITDLSGRQQVVASYAPVSAAGLQS